MWPVSSDWRPDLSLWEAKLATHDDVVVVLVLLCVACGS